MYRHKTNPLVTIAIPNYNMGEYIGEAIESAIGQTFTDFEILVVNNVSTDNSWEIVTELAKKDGSITQKKVVTYSVA